LASGAWSDYYLDLRCTTLDSGGLVAACSLLLQKLIEADVVAVGGPTLGADPLVSGILSESGRQGRPMQGFLVRSTAKDHGTGRRVEGHCVSGARVAVLDDVVTRGGSILRAIEAVRAAGAEPVLALTLVDREQGGSTAIEAEGLSFHAAFRVSEILDEADRRGL